MNKGGLTRPLRKLQFTMKEIMDRLKIGMVNEWMLARLKHCTSSRVEYSVYVPTEILHTFVT